tara:strand:- start:358 stop:708 length:351 start_codon:yes stop_codon:yes gene_type:complete
MISEISKTLFRIEQIAEVTSVSETTINRWKSELKKSKRDLSEMGCYQLKGCKYDVWDMSEFIHHLKTERQYVRPGRPNLRTKPNRSLYNYEQLEQDKIGKAILVYENNNQQLKKEY